VSGQTAVKEGPAAQSVVTHRLHEHAATLLAAARLLTMDEAEAQDLVQTTFEIALRQASTLRDPSALRAWLVTIESREYLRQARRMRRFLPFNLLRHDRAEEGLGLVESVALRDALRRLTSRVRAAIVLHYLVDYSVRDSARALGVSENTIKTELKTGLRLLREVLSDE
jgi:RNA polymerase sigma factor (sigma-70 family)